MNRSQFWKHTLATEFEIKYSLFNTILYLLQIYRKKYIVTYIYRYQPHLSDQRILSLVATVLCFTLLLLFSFEKVLYIAGDRDDFHCSIA